MVTSEHPGEQNDPSGIRDALTITNQRIDDVNDRIDNLRKDVNARIDDLREDMNARFNDLRQEVNARFRLLMWGIAVGDASILAILGALLARGG